MDKSFWAALAKLFRESPDTTLTTDQILHALQNLSRRQLTKDLLGEWKNGNLFVNHLHWSEGTYQPANHCLWCNRGLEGYFGYNKDLGAYQINENLTRLFSIQVESTMHLGSPATCVAISPDNERIATGCLNGAIHVYNLHNANLQRTLKDIQNRIWCLAYSPSGNWLASGQQNGNLTLWDVDGKIIAQSKTEDWVRSVSFSPDSKNLISSHKLNDNANPLVRLWDLPNLVDRTGYFHHKQTVWSALYRLDGKGFVSTGREKIVSCFLFGQNEPSWSEKKHLGTVTCLAMHPAGGIVASGAWTGTIKVWNVDTGKEMRTIEAHSSRIYALAFSPSGDLLASGGKDSQVAIWKMPEGIPLVQVTAHAGWVRGIAFVDENTLVTVGSEGTCKIWSLHYHFSTEHTVEIYSSSEEVKQRYERSLDEDDE